MSYYVLLSGEQLRVTSLEPAARETCEEESEVAANTICTQEKKANGNQSREQQRDSCQVFLSDEAIYI